MSTGGSVSVSAKAITDSVRRVGANCTAADRSVAAFSVRLCASLIASDRVWPASIKMG